MVELPDHAELQLLKSFNPPFCVTIYAPHIDNTSSGASNPNKIELKNLLRQAEMALLDEHVEPGEIKKTLRPARELLSNDALWPPRAESLALFLHPKSFHYYYLPDEVPHMLTIGRGFNLGPLEEAIRSNRRYLLLALSLKNVQVFEGDRFSLRRLNLKNFPSNMEDALNIDEYPKVAETHTIAPAGNGKGSEAFHGQYNIKQTKKEMMLVYFQIVDRRLRQFLQKKRLPLILAGVEYLLPIYHQANTSPYLLQEGIRGNVEHENSDVLRHSAWQVIRHQREAT